MTNKEKVSNYIEKIFNQEKRIFDAPPFVEKINLLDSGIIEIYYTNPDEIDKEAMDYFFECVGAEIKQAFKCHIRYVSDIYSSDTSIGNFVYKIKE